jgi:hypothetical protein
MMIMIMIMIMTMIIIIIITITTHLDHPAGAPEGHLREQVVLPAIHLANLPYTAIGQALDDLGAKYHVITKKCGPKYGHGSRPAVAKGPPKRPATSAQLPWPNSFPKL